MSLVSTFQSSAAPAPASRISDGRVKPPNDLLTKISITAENRICGTREIKTVMGILTREPRSSSTIASPQNNDATSARTIASTEEVSPGVRRMAGRKNTVMPSAITTTPTTSDGESSSPIRNE